MLLQFYIIFSVIGFLLIILGYKTHSEFFKVIGFSIIAILNISFLTGTGLQYQTGEIQKHNNTNINIETVEVVPVYANYKNTTIGFLLAVLGVLGTTIITWLEYNNRKEQYENGD